MYQLLSFSQQQKINAQLRIKIYISNLKALDRGLKTLDYYTKFIIYPVGVLGVS